MTALSAVGLGTSLGIAAAADSNPAHEIAAPAVDDLIAASAHDNGVPVGLARAVVQIESRGNPRASNHGALGLMQVKAATARSAGFGGGPADLFVPATNLRYGMKILAAAYRSSGGDVCHALATYQSGHAVHRFNHAQRTYCARAHALMAKA